MLFRSDFTFNVHPRPASETERVQHWRISGDEAGRLDITQITSAEPDLDHVWPPLLGQISIQIEFEGCVGSSALGSTQLRTQMSDLCPPPSLNRKGHAKLARLCLSGLPFSQIEVDSSRYVLHRPRSLIIQ